MTDDGFELLITDPGVADVYVDAEQAEVPWGVVADLDECRIQVVTDSFPADGGRRARCAPRRELRGRGPGGRWWRCGRPRR